MSELSIREFRSALLKKCRTGELDVSAANGSIQCFLNDIPSVQKEKVVKAFITQAQSRREKLKL